MTERVLGPAGGRRRRRMLVLPALVVLAVAVVFGVTSAVGANLPGSKFEIDTDANLTVDATCTGGTGCIDWAGVAHTGTNPPEIRRTDLATGQTDDSYKGGMKEDTACPETETGSIPNNKSDLLNFGSYFEPEAGGPGWLHVFWRRVQEPSGTTNMDFEFNKSTTDCDGAGSSKNVTRTSGDILLQFDVDQGGAVAKLSKRTWLGSAWSDPPVALGSTDAIGDINDSAITNANSDDLGAMTARTFGEASFDLSQVFDPTKCESFGSAMLKSRSSDSFTSQLKDFIAPVPVNITNCGTVIIRKQTDPDENPNSTDFGYTKNFNTDPSTTNTFTLKDDGVKTFTGVLFGSGKTVVEDVIPSGWDFVSVNCSASTGVTPTINGATVTFAIDNAADILDCTYTNRARGTIIVEKITDDGTGAFGFTSNTLTPSSFTLTTTAAGSGGKDSRTFSDLAPGTYDVAETVPTGWNLVSGTCSDGSAPASIGLSGGETVTCTFHDARERGAILITKTRKHAASGAGNHPHSGVTFTVTGGGLAQGITAVTNAQGQACVGNLVLSSFVGDYTVTETVPTGYSASPTSDVVTVSTEATCGSGNEAAAGPFHNTPLTDVTITVNSQVDGGTASTIDCEDFDGLDASSSVNGDISSNTETGLAPQTLTCTIVIDP